MIDPNQNSIQSPAAPTVAESSKANNGISDAAKDFEALFLQTVLKQMRSASDVLAPEDSPLSSNKQGAFRDMHDQTVAQSLAGQGQVGIAAMIERQLDPEKAGEAAKALREMRSESNAMSVSAMKNPIDTSSL
jgi:flagellar protein FlgJ